MSSIPLFHLVPPAVLLLLAFAQTRAGRFFLGVLSIAITAPTREAWALLRLSLLFAAMGAEGRRVTMGRLGKCQ